MLAAEGNVTVYALDYLGFGASEKPDVEYCPALWASQLEDLCVSAKTVCYVAAD